MYRNEILTSPYHDPQKYTHTDPHTVLLHVLQSPNQPLPELIRITLGIDKNFVSSTAPTPSFILLQYGVL